MLFGRVSLLSQTSLARFYSGETGKQWLQKLDKESFPKRLLIFRYDRSSGPGGQNVNKVNSKSTMTLHNFSECHWFPIEIRNMMISGNKSRYYYPSSDSIVIQCDETRSRTTNRDICINKFVEELRETCVFQNEPNVEAKGKWNRIRARSNEARLKVKKFQSRKKKQRQKVTLSY